ncbi:DUF1127 domain-containing protein [Mesorhizobium sophorae]|uniref:DUF1127 domain-containing protein n=1 Tax=Mesorhizobium sophorae TaxID=1300294 RepID=UPI000BA2DB40|nr:hypothetical protein [Mesorhizobium sophorae]
MTNILEFAPHKTARSGTPVAPMARRHLTTLQSIIASWHDRTWRERIRFRWELAQMARDNPYLIDDIGLTDRQVEAELAKPFWQR